LSLNSRANANGATDTACYDELGLVVSTQPLTVMTDALPFLFPGSLSASQMPTFVGIEVHTLNWFLRWDRSLAF
jgi:hypothetical protein